MINSKHKLLQVTRHLLRNDNRNIIKIAISKYAKPTFIIYQNLRISLYYIYEAASTIKTMSMSSQDFVRVMGTFLVGS